jgi:hypothetical protein
MVYMRVSQNGTPQTAIGKRETLHSRLVAGVNIALAHVDMTVLLMVHVL